jgi:hypothetical protein
LLARVDVSSKIFGVDSLADTSVSIEPQAPIRGAQAAIQRGINDKLDLVDLIIRHSRLAEAVH